MLTALYHWEQLYPRILPTQPTEPSQFAQKQPRSKKPPGKPAPAKSAADAHKSAEKAREGKAHEKVVEEVDPKEDEGTLEAVAGLFGDAESQESPENAEKGKDQKQEPKAEPVS